MVNKCVSRSLTITIDLISVHHVNAPSRPHLALNFQVNSCDAMVRGWLNSRPTISTKYTIGGIICSSNHHQRARTNTDQGRLLDDTRACPLLNPFAQMSCTMKVSENACQQRSTPFPSILAQVSANTLTNFGAQSMWLPCSTMAHSNGWLPREHKLNIQVTHSGKSQSR